MELIQAAVKSYTQHITSFVHLHLHTAVNFLQPDQKLQPCIVTKYAELVQCPVQVKNHGILAYPYTLRKM